MSEEQKREKILEFLKSNPFGVLSYLNKSNDQPQSAVVAYSETSELEIIFGTYNDNRKYKHLKENPKVSFAIGWDEELGHTLQYEGEAREVEGEEFQECLKIHIAKLPGAEKYVYQENETFFKVSPKWARFTEYWEEPPKVFEIKF